VGPGSIAGQALFACACGWEEDFLFAKLFDYGHWVSAQSSTSLFVTNPRIPSSPLYIDHSPVTDFANLISMACANRHALI
jgi:hypothetical protein